MKKRLIKRKSSAVLTACAGAAVCLTGGGVAQAVTGSINASNGRVSFGYSIYPIFRAFGGKVSFNIFSSTLMDFEPIGNKTTQVLMYVTSIRKFSAGVLITSAMGGVWGGARTFPPHLGHGSLHAPVSDKYFAVRFTEGTLRYGWVHVVSASDTLLQLDTWGYDTDGNITTLSGSVTTRRLGHSDGKITLCWANANEDGVARYEVQAKDASGVWRAVDSGLPGEGVYTAKGDSDAEYRLVIEKVDGTTEETGF